MCCLLRQKCFVDAPELFFNPLDLLPCRGALLIVQLHCLRAGEPQCRFDLTPRSLPDFAATCRYHQTSPRSHFTRNTVCSLATPDGRVTVRGRTLIVTSDSRRDERTLTDRELLDAYRRRFGIELERLPPLS